MVNYFQFASCVTYVPISSTNFTASTRRQTRVIDPSNIERTLNRCLNSQICVSNRCMEKNESKFERNETLSDLFNSDALCIATSFTVIHVVFSWYVILAVFSIGNLCIP